MGLLEIVFKIGLAHPLLLRHAPGAPIVVTPDTGNTVYVDPPDRSPLTEYQKNLGAFSNFKMRVRRECADDEGRNVAINELRSLHILRDAARVLWEFFETVREVDFRTDGAVVGYPVARAEEIQDNALVRTCELECFYEGALTRTIPLSSHPAIQMTERAWKEAERRLITHEEVPRYVSFALDAAYFADSDPVRAIIMACAAWEGALRSYLLFRQVAPAHKVQNARFPKLYDWMRAAKGGELFHDYYGHRLDAHWDYQRKVIFQLPILRNELLHQGKSAIPEGVALDAALAVLNAVEWLIQDY